MTEVSIPQAAPNALAPIVTDTVKSLAEWASEMKAAEFIANGFCNTMFAPAHFRGKPDECAAAILYGDTLGLPPTVALRSIYAVHGTPALYAQQMYAIAIAKGHEIERVSATETAVSFRGRRRGATAWQTVEWTIERARKAKYTSNSKYQENPIGMLTEKCKAEISKLVAPDALAGISSVEEIELGDFQDLGEVPAAAAAAPAAEPKAKAKVQRRQAPAAELPAVVHHAPVETVEPDPEPVGMATQEQITHLVVALKSAGHTTNEAKAAAVQEQVGRTLGGFQDLTIDEAAGLTEYFNTMAPQETPDDDAAAADAAWLAGAK